MSFWGLPPWSIPFDEGVPSLERPEDFSEQIEFLLVGEEDNAKERLDHCPWSTLHTLLV